MQSKEPNYFKVRFLVGFQPRLQARLHKVLLPFMLVRASGRERDVSTTAVTLCSPAVELEGPKMVAQASPTTVPTPIPTNVMIRISLVSK